MKSSYNSPLGSRVKSNQVLLFFRQAPFPNVPEIPHLCGPWLEINHSLFHRADGGMKIKWDNRHLAGHKLLNTEITLFSLLEIHGR